MIRSLVLQLLAVVCVISAGFGGAARSVTRQLAIAPVAVGPDAWERLVDSLTHLVAFCNADPQCSEEELATYKELLQDALFQKSNS